MTRKTLFTFIAVAAALGLTVGAVTQTVIHRYSWSSATGLTGGVGYGSTEPTLANSGAGPIDGELYVTRASGSDPDLQIYSDTDGAWRTLMYEGGPTLSGAVSVSGAVTLGGDEDDTITANGPVVFEVTREDFDGPNFLAIDFTNADYAPTVADTEANVYVFQHMQVYVRNEQAFGGTNTPATFLDTSIDTASTQNIVWKVSDPTIVDANDNDGVEFNFGGAPTQPTYDSASLESAYCEASIRIDDISDLSANDVYFGWLLAAAIDDAFAAEASSDTYAIFEIIDNAGDLTIDTNLNGGGVAEDDAGVTWADDATHVLRVEISASAVAFYVDGTAVSQTNATLDPDAGDEFVCRLGYRSSGTDPGMELNYVEMGRAQ